MEQRVQKYAALKEATRALRKKDSKTEVTAAAEVVDTPPRRVTRRNSTSTPILQHNTPIKAAVRGVTPEPQGSTPVRRSRRLSQTNEPPTTASATLKQNIFAAVKEEDEQPKIPNEGKENNSLMVNEGENKTQKTNNTKKPRILSQQQASSQPLKEMDFVKKLLTREVFGTPPNTKDGGTKRNTDKKNYEMVGDVIILDTPINTKKGEKTDAMKEKQESNSAVEPMEDQEEDNNLTLLLSDSDDVLEESAMKHISLNTKFYDENEKLEKVTIPESSSSSTVIGHKIATNVENTPARKSINKKNISFSLSEVNKSEMKEKAAMKLKTPDIKRINNSSTNSSSSSKHNINSNEGQLSSSERNKEKKDASVKKSLDWKGSNTTTPGSSKPVSSSTSAGDSKPSVINKEGLLSSSERNKEKKDASVKKSLDWKGSNTTTPGSSKPVSSSTSAGDSKPSVINKEGLLSSSERNKEKTASVKKSLDWKGSNSTTPDSSKPFGSSTTPDDSKPSVINKEGLLSSSERNKEKTASVKKTFVLKGSNTTTPGSSKPVGGFTTPGDSKPSVINKEGLLSSSERNKEKTASVKKTFDCKGSNTTTPGSSKPVGGFTTPGDSKPSVINKEGLLSSSERNKEKTASVKKTFDCKGSNTTTPCSSKPFGSSTTPDDSKRNIINNEGLLLTAERNEEKDASVKKTFDLKGSNTTTPGSSKPITSSTAPDDSKRNIINNEELLLTAERNKEKTASVTKTMDVLKRQATPFSKPKTNYKSLGEKSAPESGVDNKEKSAAVDMIKKTPDFKDSSKHIAADTKEKSIQKKTPGTPGNTTKKHIDNVSESKQHTDDNNKSTAKKDLFQYKEDIDHDKVDNASSVMLGDKPQITEIKYLNAVKPSLLAKIISDNATKTDAANDEVFIEEKTLDVEKTKVISFNESEVEDKPKMTYPKTPARVNVRTCIQHREDNNVETYYSSIFSSNNYDVNEYEYEKIGKKKLELETEEATLPTYVKVQKSAEKKVSLAEKKESAAPKETEVVAVAMETEEKNVSDFKKEEEPQGKETYPIAKASTEQKGKHVEESMQEGISKNKDQNEEPLTSSETVNEKRKQPQAVQVEEKNKDSLFRRSWNHIIQVEADMMNTKIDTIKPMKTEEPTIEIEESDEEEVIDITAEFSPQSSDEEIQGDDDEVGEEVEPNKKSDYIEDEAIEIKDYESGDSLSNEERLEIEENEIVDIGESLGSESDNDIEEDDDDVEYEKDSFVVSSGDEVEEAKEITKNTSLSKYHRIKMMSDDSDDNEKAISLVDEEEDEQQSDEGQLAKFQSLVVGANKSGNEKKMVSTNEKLLSLSLSDVKEKVMDPDKKLFSFSFEIGVSDKNKKEDATLMKFSNIITKNNDKNNKQDNDIVDVVKEKKADINSLDEKDVDDEDKQLNEPKTCEENGSKQLELETEEENKKDEDSSSENEYEKMEEEGNEESNDDWKLKVTRALLSKVINSDEEDYKQLEKLSHLNSFFNPLQKSKRQSLIIHQSSSSNNNTEENKAEQSRLRRKTICPVQGQDFNPSRSFIETLQERKRFSGKRKRLSKSFSSATDAALSQDMGDDILQHIHKKLKKHPIKDDDGSDKDEVVEDLSSPPKSLFDEEEEEDEEEEATNVTASHNDREEDDAEKDSILEAANRAMLEKLLRKQQNKHRRVSPQKSLEVVFKKKLKRLNNEQLAVKNALKVAENMLLAEKNSVRKHLNRRQLAKEVRKQKKLLKEEVQDIRKKTKRFEPIENIIKTASGYFLERPLTPVNENRYIKEFIIPSGVMRVEPVSPINRQFRIEPISPHCINLAGQGQYIENRRRGIKTKLRAKINGNSE